MKKRWVSHSILVVMCALLGLSLFSSGGWAAASGSGACDVLSNNSMTGCNGCISNVVFENFLSGEKIITAAFTTVNSVLSKVMKSFFNGIVSDTSFQAVIGTAILLYVAMYGLIIMFGLGTYRTNEVATRLFKIGLVYILTSPAAWTGFTTWVYNPIIHGMNFLINAFTVQAEGASGTLTKVTILYGSGIASGGDLSGGAAGGLDVNAFNTMFGSSISTVFSTQFMVAMLSMTKTGDFGWAIMLCLMWGLIEFGRMLIDAVVIYAKAIIALAFLFGIAPLFFVFLLFDKTRQIFMSWVAQVVTFALQPVMLFAFLSFYVALINQATPKLLTDTKGNHTDFCWTNWLAVPGSIWNSFFWTPTNSGGLHPGGWTDASGYTIEEPINVPNALYFLILCHLARIFSKFISTIAQDIGGGIAMNSQRGPDAYNWAKKGVGGAMRGMKGQTK